MNSISLKSYGVLSWEEHGCEIKDRIEYATGNYSSLIKYLRNKVIDSYTKDKRPFRYKYIIIYQVFNIDPRLVSFKIISKSGHYFKLKYKQNLIFKIHDQEGNLYQKIIQSIPEWIDLHNLSYKLIKVNSKWTKWGLRKYIQENNLNIDNYLDKSRSDLKRCIREYYLNEILG